MFLSLIVTKTLFLFLHFLFLLFCYCIFPHLEPLTQFNFSLCCCVFKEKYGLSFLETSALDSSNVELAFHTILTGQCPVLFFIFFVCHN